MHGLDAYVIQRRAAKLGLDVTIGLPERSCRHIRQRPKHLGERKPAPSIGLNYGRLSSTSSDPAAATAVAPVQVSPAGFNATTDAAARGLSEVALAARRVRLPERLKDCR